MGTLLEEKDVRIIVSGVLVALKLLQFQRMSFIRSIHYEVLPLASVICLDSKSFIVWQHFETQNSNQLFDILIVPFPIATCKIPSRIAAAGTPFNFK